MAWFCINDEGDYWPARDETRLRASLDYLNRVTAGLAGALKNAAGSDGGGIASVQAAIFEHPHFEHLEAEASTGEDAKKIAEALRAVRKTIS